jgi:hypothetical protein
MTCQETLDRLDDYVDGTLSEAEFQEVELHIAGCADCAAEHAFLRDLLARAAELPRDVAPPRDLWPGIAARLGGRDEPRSYWLMGLAAAAAVLLSVIVAVRQPGSETTGPGTTGQGTTIPVSSDRLPPELESAEREYERATAQLLAAIAARRDSLPAETVQALDVNLRAIDQALVDVRAAVRADPTNPRLNHLLASTHQRKVETLLRVVKLTT